MEIINNYINGTFELPKNGTYLDNFEPATGLVYSKIPNSELADIDAAVVAAQNAWEGWKNLSNDDRCTWIEKIADGIENRIDEFAMAESKDNGKPISLARSVDIPRAISNFRFFAKAVTQWSSESHHMVSVGINYTLRQPIGVVGCISPWNLPLYLLTWKIAPALATGNTVIAKPSEVTPYTAFLLSDVCREIGLPAGVLNLVHGTGSEVGEAICTHPTIKAISFTGGSSTGKRIASVAAPMFKKLSLELGGKNPNIIFADCNYDKMLATTLRSSFSNQGQICLCGSRIFIERPLYDRFKTDFVAAVKTLQIGDPNHVSTNIGAVVSESHMDKIISYINLAKHEGGTILCGGTRAKVEERCASGWFIYPTVIEGLDYTCRTNQEEIFGPVVTLTPFDTEEEVVQYANSTTYGLAATVWTENLSRAHTIADVLDFGIIWINCWMVRDLRTPFGGVKSSGVGREGGVEALRFFTEAKNVCIAY